MSWEQKLPCDGVTAGHVTICIALLLPASVRVLDIKLFTHLKCTYDPGVRGCHLHHLWLGKIGIVGQVSFAG